MKRILPNYLRKKLANFHLDKEEVIEENTPQKGRTSSFFISAVQREITLVKTIDEFASRMEGFVKRATKEGSELIAFPEYNTFDLLGLLPFFHLINNRLNSEGKEMEQQMTEREYLLQLMKKNGAKTKQIKGEALSTKGIRWLFETVANPTKEILITIMKRLAKKYKIYIYTGSYFTVENGKLFNAGTLVDRSGNIVGTQKKLHLTDFEDELNIERGNKLQIYSLDFANVAIPICMDGTYFETFHLAEKLGADLIILPIANNEEYDTFKAMRGMWARVQETNVIGVKPSLNGLLGGMKLTGKAGIFAPNGYKDEEMDELIGILSISPHYIGDDLITTEISLNKLYFSREISEYSGDNNSYFESLVLQKYKEMGKKHV